MKDNRQTVPTKGELCRRRKDVEGRGTPTSASQGTPSTNRNVGVIVLIPKGAGLLARLEIDFGRSRNTGEDIEIEVLIQIQTHDFGSFAVG